MKIPIWIKVVDWKIYYSLWEPSSWYPIDYDELHTYYENPLYSVRQV